ncbi:hypothetical protein [Aeropyrum camini]|uniref:hypothetical protein n=1 Tax=Aeropyrum camini TaxID=229980 RepID=UPI003F6EEBDB
MGRPRLAECLSGDSSMSELGGGGVYLLDLDSVVDGSALRMISSGSLRGRVLVHSALVDYLYGEAKKGRSAATPASPSSQGLWRLGLGMLRLLLWRTILGYSLGTRASSSRSSEGTL